MNSDVSCFYLLTHTMPNAHAQMCCGLKESNSVTCLPEKDLLWFTDVQVIEVIKKNRIKRGSWSDEALMLSAESSYHPVSILPILKCLKLHVNR